MENTIPTINPDTQAAISKLLAPKPVAPTVPNFTFGVTGAQPQSTSNNFQTSTASSFAQPVQPSPVAQTTAPQIASAPTQNGYTNGVDPATYARLDNLFKPQSSVIPSYSSGVSDYLQTNPTTETQKPFEVPKNTTYGSNYLTGGNSLQDLLDTRNSMQNNLMNGKSSGTVASDNLYSMLASNLYNSSLYSPEQKAAMQNLSDLNTKISATTLADQRMIKDLQENGAMTKDQASAFVSEATRRNNADLANLSIAQTAQTNQLGVLGQYQQNQVGALQNISGLLTPQAVSPGSSLYNPITGVQYQGQGGSPQAILSYAQQLVSNDQSQGTLQLNPDGSINQNYYQQAAQAAFSGGQAPMGQSTQAGQSQGQPSQLQQIAQSLVDGTLAPSNIPQGLNQAAVLNMANQISQSTTGQPFDANKAQANYAATQASLTQNATTFRALSNAQQTAVSHLDDLQTYFSQIPKTNYPMINGVVNWIQGALGSQGLQAYNTALSAARGEIAKVLAGGGAPSESENKAASAVLPDNMSPGQLQGAIQSAKLLMQQKIAEYSNTGNVPQYGQNNQSQQSSGGIIQTKIGAVDNSWFNN